MHDLTHVYKAVMGFVIAALCPYMGLSYVSLIYGREWGQKQTKLQRDKTINILMSSGALKKNIFLVDYLRNIYSVAKLGMKGFCFLSWSKGNQFDFYGALTGFILGVIIWFLITKEMIRSMLNVIVY